MDPQFSGNLSGVLRPLGDPEHPEQGMGLVAMRHSGRGHPSGPRAVRSWRRRASAPLEGRSADQGATPNGMGEREVRPPPTAGVRRRRWLRPPSRTLLGGHGQVQWVVGQTRVADAGGSIRSPLGPIPWSDTPVFAPLYVVDGRPGVLVECPWYEECHNAHGDTDTLCNAQVRQLCARMHTLHR